MKQFKPVLICAAVLLVISLAVLVATKLVPENTPEEPGIDAGEVELSESIKITDLSTNEIASIEIAQSPGEGFAIDYFDKEVGKGATMRGADSRLAYDEEKMKTLAHYLAPLAAFGEVGKGEDSAFGFDKPQRTIKIVSRKGEETTLLIGDNLPVGEGAYVRRADRDDVYTVGKATAQTLLREKTEYRDFELFDEFENPDLITVAEYTPYGKEMIKVVRRTEEEVAEEEKKTALSIYYKIVSPVSVNTDPEKVATEFLDKIVKIKALRVVEDNPKDLSKYGLAKPAKLRFETSDGISVSLLIGNDSESGSSYVMLEGVPSVIETEENVSLSSLTHSDIMMKLLWFFNSKEISGFDYKLSDGKEASFALLATDKETKGTFNGKKLEGKNAHNLYLRTVRFTLAGECTGSEKYEEPEITVKASLKNGKTSTLSLCKMNERQYAAVIDGAPARFYVAVAEVRELLEAIDLVFLGKEIPDMF